jgi:putative hemolysin
MKKFLILSLLIPVVFLSACSQKAAEKNTVAGSSVSTSTEGTIIATTTATTTAGLPNPASANCTKQGGEIKIVTRNDGGQYGICFFENNLQCEEWAMLRGDCPVGGLKITDYDNGQQIYCAITGGEVNISKNTCTIKGQVCSLDDYFNGSCPRS